MDDLKLDIIKVHNILFRVGTSFDQYLLLSCLEVCNFILSTHSTYKLADVIFEEHLQENYYSGFVVIPLTIPNVVVSTLTVFKFRRNFDIVCRGFGWCFQRKVLCDSLQGVVELPAQ